MSLNRFKRLLHRVRASRSGFSLTEALVTLAIVGLVTSAMATGIAFAVKQYDESMATSESRVLQSTLKNAIQNELAITNMVVLDGNEADASRQVVAFFSPNYAVKEGYSEFKLVNSRTDSSGNPYGELALGTGSDKTKWKKLISSSSYHKNLGAQVQVVYHKADEATGVPAHFTVAMKILGGPDRVMVDDTFDVVPLNEVDCINVSDMT